MNKEIEIKFRPTQEQTDTLTHWLSQKNIKSKEIKITDYYFDHKTNSLFFLSPEGFLDTDTSFRLRIIDNTQTLYIKKRVLDTQDNMLHAQEYSLNINHTKTQFLDILDFLSVLGYMPKVIINKTRKIYIYKSLEISIDALETLGEFIEIEIISNTKTGHTEQENQDINSKNLIYNFLKELGFKSILCFTRGYLVMTVNPNYNFITLANL
jgi:predicted adenylyl cyclase CyaB